MRRDSAGSSSLYGQRSKNLLIYKLGVQNVPILRALREDLIGHSNRIFARSARFVGASDVLQ